MKLKEVLAAAESVDISRFEKPRNRVRLIGVELEGGWNKLPKGVKLTHDGSVQIEIPYLAREYYAAHSRWAADYEGPTAVGELVSAPMPVGDLEKWMRQSYPPFHNSSCGMHLHMSFRAARLYERLMEPSYQSTIFKEVAKWAKGKIPSDHHLWERLKGENRYCKRDWYADAQAAATSKSRIVGGDRYTAINYCLSLHSTIECRLLPMMPTVDLAIGALQEVLRITNAYLYAGHQAEESTEGAVELAAGESVYREDQTEVI